jgi:hypothetical protein
VGVLHVCSSTDQTVSYLFFFLKRGGCKDCCHSQLIEEKYIAMMKFYMVFTLQSADNSCSIIRVPLGSMNFGWEVVQSHPPHF